MTTIKPFALSHRRVEQNWSAKVTLYE